MKRQKLKRRTYRPVSKKIKTVKKVVWRILFVLICAVALCVFSVYLGSWLKERAAQIDGVLSTDDTTGTESATHETLPPKPNDPAEDTSVCAAYLDVLSMNGADIEEYVSNLHESYNTVSINITSDDGKLVYVSPALLEYVKLDPSNVTAAPIVGNTDGDDEEAYEIDVLSNIKVAVDCAERKGLRTCAMYSASPTVLNDTEYEGAWEIDSVVIRELCELGFDEVLICGLYESEQAFKAEHTAKVAAYSVYLREKVGEIGIGMALPEEKFDLTSCVSTLKTVNEYTDFLCIYVHGEGENAEEAYSLTYENYHSVKGTLKAFNIRTIILDEDETIAAAVATALRDLASVNVHFANMVEVPVYSAETVEDDTTVPDSAETAYNENANRKENYTDDTESENGDSTEG